MKIRLVLIVIGLVLGIFAMRWFFLNFEYVEDRAFIGYSKEARRNPYLAAERLITRMGIPATELRSLASLRDLPPRGVLVIGEERDVLTPNARQMLLEWVKQGGYLITEDISVEKADPLLDVLRVRREEVSAADRGSEGWPLVEIELPGAARTLKVQMHEWQSIERSESLLRARSKNANHLLHFRHGEGYVTVLNSMWFIQNAAMGKNDHAAFLYGLVALVPERSGAAFFNQPTDLSLWSWLREYAWAVVACGLLALLLYLWRIAPRFGPVAADPQRQRRSLLEHLRACGRFEWKVKGGPQLAEAARDVAWRRVARMHPELAGLSAEATQQQLAELYVLHQEDTRRLIKAGAENQSDFIRSIQVYQRVHERLMPQSKTIPGEKA